MKAKLIFDLPDDKAAFALASKAWEWYSLAFDFSQWLRDRLKYGELSDEAAKAYQDCSDNFYALMAEEGISFNDAN